LRRRIDALTAFAPHMPPRKPLQPWHFHQTNNIIAKVPMDWALLLRHPTRLREAEDARATRQSAVAKRLTAGAERFPPREKFFRRSRRCGRYGGLVSAQNARIGAN
jgi:hypothetical protein